MNERERNSEPVVEGIVVAQPPVFTWYPRDRNRFLIHWESTRKGTFHVFPPSFFWTESPAFLSHIIWKRRVEMGVKIKLHMGHNMQTRKSEYLLFY